MDFFGITYFGPKNYIHDSLRSDYKEPMCEDELKELVDKMEKTSHPLIKVSLEAVLDEAAYRYIDCYLGRVNGFAYGSFQHFLKIKKKGLLKPVGPIEMHRFPLTTSTDIGWWQSDSALDKVNWYRNAENHPIPSSPNTRILDAVRKNNKYATFF